MQQRTANLLLLLAGAVWGMGFVAQQTAMEFIGPMAFMVFRFLLAAVAVSLFARAETKKHNHGSLTPTDRRSLLTLGVVFFVPMALQQVGILVTTVTSAGFLTGLYVVIVPFIVLIGLRQEQHWVVWPGAGLAFVGIYFLGDGGFSGLTWGDWLIALSAVFAAIHIVYLGRTIQRLHRPVLIATSQFAVSACLSLVGYVLFRWFPTTQQIEPVVTLARLSQAAPQILYGGLVAGGLAFTLMAIGQRHTKEAHAAILISSEALFAALLGAVLLGERLGPRGYFGMLLMFSAILLVQLVPLLGVRSG